MSKGSRAGSRGPLAPHAPGFGATLVQAGYSRSAAKKQLQLMARLSAWLDDEGLELGDLATAQVERFFDARRAVGYANLVTSRAVAPLVEHLLRTEAIAAPVPVVTPDPGEALLERFRLYLVRERCLVEGTARFYVHVARLLVSERVDADGVDLAGLRAGERHELRCPHLCGPWVVLGPPGGLGSAIVPALFDRGGGDGSGP